MNDKKTPISPLRQDYLSDLVEQLVRLRKIQGLTQEALNYKLGVADRLVSKWECGTRNPTLFNLHCWARALGARLMVSCNDNVKPFDCQYKQSRK